MASNIPEKNLIYSFDDYASLPYKDEHNINYSNENSFINSTSLNNTYQQLVDNDLHIAQELNNRRGWKVGPLSPDGTSTLATTYSMQNGQKIFESSSSAKVLKKVEKTVQESLKKSTSSQFVDGVTHVFEVDSDIVLICTQSSTYAASITSIEKAKNVDAIEVLGPGSQNISIDSQCYGYCSSIFFVGKSNGIYGIYRLDVVNAVQLQYAFSLQYSAIDATIPSIASRVKDSSIFIAVNNATSTSLLKASINDRSIDTSSMQQIYYMPLANGSSCIQKVVIANDLNGKIPIDKSILLFMEDGSVYASSFGSDLQTTGYYVFQQDDIDVYRCRAVDDYSLYATSNGIYIRDIYGQISHLQTSLTGVVDVASYKGTTIAAVNASSHGELYDVNCQDGSTTKITDTPGQICAIQIVNGIPFIACNDSLGILVNNKRFQPISSYTIDGITIDGTNLSCAALAQQMQNDTYTSLYATGTYDGINETPFFMRIDVSAATETESTSLEDTTPHAEAVYPQQPDDAVFKRLFNAYIDDQHSEIHQFAVIEKQDATQIVDLNAQTAALSFGSDCHGIVCANSKVYVFMEDGMLVYSSVSASSLYTEKYEYYDLEDILGQSDSLNDWEVVDGHISQFDSIEYIVLAIIINSTNKIVCLCIDNDNYNVHPIEIGIESGSISSCQMLGNSIAQIDGSKYYSLSSDGQHICRFQLKPILDSNVGIDPSYGVTWQWDSAISSYVRAPVEPNRYASIDYSNAILCKGLEKWYIDENYQYVSSDWSSGIEVTGYAYTDRYIASHIDYLAYGDHIDAISSLVLMTDEGPILVEQPSLLQYGDYIKKIDIVQPHIGSNAIAAMYIDSSRNLHCKIACEEGNMQYFTSKVQSDPSYAFKQTSDSQSNTIVIDSSSTIIDAVIAYADIQHIVIVFSSQLGTKCATIEYTVDGATLTTSMAINDVIPMEMSILLPIGDGKVIGANGNRLCRVYGFGDGNGTVIESSQLDINGPITSLNAVYEIDSSLEQIDGYSMIDSTTLPGDSYDHSASIIGNYYTREYTSDSMCTLYATTSSSIIEISIAIDNSINVINVKSTHFDENTYGSITNAFTAYGTPFSLYNATLAMSFFGSQNANSIILVCRKDSEPYSLRNFTYSNRWFILESTDACQDFYFQAGISISKLEQDASGVVWLVDANGKTYAYYNRQLISLQRYYGYSIVPCPTNAGEICFYYIIDGQPLSCATYSDDGHGGQAFIEKRANTIASPIAAIGNSTSTYRQKPFLVCYSNDGLLQIQTYQYQTIIQAPSAVVEFFSTARDSTGGEVDIDSNYGLVKKIVPIANSHDILLVSDYIDNQRVVYDSSYMYVKNFNSRTVFPLGKYQHVAFPDGVYSEGTYFAYFKQIDDQIRLVMQTSLQPASAIAISPDTQIGKLASKPSFTLQLMSYSNNSYYLVAKYAEGIQHKTAQIQFSGVTTGDAYIFRYGTARLDENDCPQSVLDIGGGNYIIAATRNLYRYGYQLDSRLQIDDYCYQTYYGDIGHDVEYFQQQGKTTYVAIVGNRSLSSSTGMNWQDYALFGSDGKVDCYVQANAHTILAGKSSIDKGLYFSTYTYLLDDDTPEFTVESALAAYELCASNIDLSIGNAIGQHVATQHNEYSPLHLLNSYMQRDFQIPDGFTYSAFGSDGKPIEIHNDYIEHILVGDSSTGEIAARATNTTIGNGVWKDIDNVSYIVKQWKSGLMEFYIYVPTTYTYYIPHIDGAGNCTSDGNAVPVNAQMVVPNIAQNATYIQIDLLSTYFYIDGMLENVIKGNSLPLKIYKDATYQDSEGPATKMFHSFIEPSIVANADTTTTEFDNYSLNYCCFGSDAQAIKLTVYDSKQNFKKKYKTVVYHGQNGRTYSRNLETVTQRILEDDFAKPMYWDIFQYDGGIFLGWSTNKDADKPDTMNYPNGKTFDYRAMSATSLHLYAVWISYAFGPDDTTITIQNAAEQTYTVSQVTIDPNIVFTNGNPQLQNRLIINFDGN